MLHGLDIDQAVLMPEANLGQLLIPRADPQDDGLVRIDPSDAELQGIEHDPAIGVRGALEADAEEILRGLQGRRRGEGPEEGPLLLECLLEAPSRDLPGRGVHPAVVECTRQ